MLLDTDSYPTTLINRLLRLSVDQ